MVPQSFRDEVERVLASARGGDLDLLAHDAAGMPWEGAARELLRGARSRLTARHRGGAGEGHRALLFTGHMVDAPGRARPRFPPTAWAEEAARRAIREAVATERDRGAPLHGMAGGASGGDILFHEACAELGIATSLLLALPPEAYATESVRPAGRAWEERFAALLAAHPERRVLAPSKDPPPWLAGRAGGYDLWARAGLWLFHSALAESDGPLTMLALWDGAAGDGPGGTADLVGRARRRGARVVILDTGDLFGRSSPAS